MSFSPLTFTPLERVHDAALLKSSIPISVNAVTLKQGTIICRGPLFYLSAYLTHFCHLYSPLVWKAVQFSCTQTHTITRTKRSFTPWCRGEVCGPSAALSCNSPWVWKHAGAAGSQRGAACPSSVVLHCLAPLAIKLNGAPAGSQRAVYDPSRVPSPATSLLMEGASPK